jgi:divalent metal cation (Fe/Co/Zn/Cd) transporter
VAFDGVIAFALGCYLLWIAGGILKSSMGDVLDASLEPAEVEDLSRLIHDAAGQRAGFHDLRTRRTGQVRHIDFHMTFPGAMTVEQSHAIIDGVEARIEAMWPGSVVTVHAEPESEAPQEPPL